MSWTITTATPIIIAVSVFIVAFGIVRGYQNVRKRCSGLSRHDYELIQRSQQRAYAILDKDMRAAKQQGQNFLQFLQSFSPADMPGTDRGDACIRAFGSVAPKLRAMWEDL